MSEKIWRIFVLEGPTNTGLNNAWIIMEFKNSIGTYTTKPTKNNKCIEFKIEGYTTKMKDFGIHYYDTSTKETNYKHDKIQNLTDFQMNVIFDSIFSITNKKEKTMISYFLKYPKKLYKNNIFQKMFKKLCGR